MEIDFSNKIKELFANSSLAARSGPKSDAQTPAKPEERKKGSLKNKKDSASSDESSSITFSAQITSALETKVKDHNAKYEKKTTLGQLKKIYRRGAGAFSSSHRVGMTRGGWAMARVNMFLKMLRGGTVKDSYRKADQDVAQGHDLYYIERDEDAFWEFENIEFDLAKLDLIYAGIEVWDQDQEAEDLEFSDAEKKTLNRPFRLPPEPNVSVAEEGAVNLFDMDYSGAEKKTLNKPFRFPSGSNKKFGVYVKNDKGNTVMVKFGDPNMEIKRDNPARRSNYRARHHCDTAVGPKWKANYWSCKFWSSKPVSSLASAEEFLLSDHDGLEWGWDESTFVSQEDLFAENPDLRNLIEILE
jgi:hypothetical protein